MATDQEGDGSGNLQLDIELKAMQSDEDEANNNTKQIDDKDSDVLAEIYDEVIVDKPSDDIKQNGEEKAETFDDCIFCSEPLQLKSTTERVECTICQCTNETSVKFLDCTNETCDSSKCINICFECSCNLNELKKEAEKTHHVKSMYYVYNDTKISGPFDCDELISLYIKNTFPTNTIHFMSAGGRKYGKWYKLPLPTETVNGSRSIAFYARKYNSTKRKFPEIYNNLIENIFLGKISPVEPAPLTIPKTAVEEQKKSMVLLSMSGKLLLFFMLVIMALHCFPFVIIAFCYMCTCNAFFNVTNYDPDDVDGCDWYCMMFFFHIWFFIGMAASPAIVVFCILSFADIYEEIQSWQIAYLTWGIFSCSILMVYAMTTTFRNAKKQKRWIHIANNITSYVVGIDFGQLDLIKKIKEVYIYDMVTGQAKNYITAMLLIVLPSFAALLPAAIVGFISNYILQEKFELKCRANIINDDICFDSEYGCCEVISSHNWENTYVFMGGLASNILATWAIIRICGFLLVKAHPQFAVYAQQRKR